jgi:hypothetical protein
MSTKIYNGYCSNMGLANLLEKLKEFKEEALKSLDAEYFKSLVSTYVKEYADAEIKIPTQTEEDINHNDLLYRLHGECEKHLSGLKKHERSYFHGIELDLETSICVFPISPNRTLMLWYCDVPVVTQMWENLPFVKDYHYQDQTDRPDEISSGAWRRREKDWEKVLGGTGWGKPVDNGYIYQIKDREIPWYRKRFDHDLQSFIPTERSRKKKIIHDRKWSERFAEIKKENPDQNSSFSHYMDFREEFNEKWEKGEYREEIQAIQTQEINFDPKLNK